MKPEIIVAIDIADDMRYANYLIENIPSPVFKVGLELIYSGNLRGVVKWIRDKKSKLFFDAKLSDIPTTVEKATTQIIRNYEPEFLTVRNNVKSALEAAQGTKTLIVDVPRLTSDIGEFKYAPTNASAIVCPPYTAITYRQLYPNISIICPGVRLAEDNNNEHQGSTFIPKDADYIVVGRPITQSDDPLATYNKYLKAIEDLNGN